MKVIKVNLKERSYPIIIGFGLLNKAGKFIKRIPNVKIALIITNSKIKHLYGKILANSLQSAGITPYFALVADSEKSKSIKTWIQVINRISRIDKGKGVAVIALGGGVIGDLSGFVAATYKRGVPLVQIPTTLLAQVDSAIGGKTAIDLSFGKNLVGAFYQPKMVLSDLGLIKTLPKPQIRASLAEIIKYAVILDKQLFVYIEKNIKKILDLDKNCILKVISACSRLKADVVAADEKETSGYRSILNFGHTIGHALESCSLYSKNMPHGKAVAIGMLCACDIAVTSGLLNMADAKRIEALIKRTGLPTDATSCSPSKALAATSFDKKIIAGAKRFILPARIGHALVCSNIQKELIKKAIYSRVKA
ncbi:MAG: 3-dehydroquinate synthase [Candidatus Omnitrophota bacterium]